MGGNAALTPMMRSASLSAFVLAPAMADFPVDPMAAGSSVTRGCCAQISPLTAERLSDNQGVVQASVSVEPRFAANNTATRVNIRPGDCVTWTVPAKALG